MDKAITESMGVPCPAFPPEWHSHVEQLEKKN
jgi:hypothetical protein